MLTSRTARWTAGTALLCLALLAVSWLFLVSPRRAEAQQLRDENAAAQNQNDLLEVKIAQLRSQFVKLPESQAALADILAQMPSDAGMPRLVRDLDSMASRSGVELTSIAPGAAQTLTTTAATPGAAATAAADPAAAGAAGAAAGATSGIVQIPVTLVVSGDYFQSVAFLKQLQTQMPRAFLVTAVQMTGSSADSATGTSGGSSTGTSTGTVQVTITGSVFSLPQTGTDATATTGTASGGGAATSSSPVTGTAATPAAGTATTPTASAN